MIFLCSIEEAHKDEGLGFAKIPGLILECFAFSLLSSDLCRHDNMCNGEQKIRAKAFCIIGLEKLTK
jgi:hypothetical protein